MIPRDQRCFLWITVCLGLAVAAGATYVVARWVSTKGPGSESGTLVYLSGTRKWSVCL